RAFVAQRGGLRTHRDAAVQLEDGDALAFPLLDVQRHQTSIFMPIMASTSSVGIISMASHGQPSRKAPSGPLLTHFLHPMQRNGSTSMWPKGGCSSSGTQYMQSATGQYGTQAGDPAQPVQHSVMIASSLGRFFRGVAIPSDFGSILTTSASMSGLCHSPEAACHLITEVWFDVQRNHMAHPATYPLNAAALATRTEVQA